MAHACVAAGPDARRACRGRAEHFPSLTYPSHTTMATGALPVRHGIWSNQALDPVDDPPWLKDARLIRVPARLDLDFEAPDGQVPPGLLS